MKNGRRKLPVRLAILAALALLVAVAQGCSGVQHYALYRAQDAVEILDLGVTITKTPQFALYGTFFTFATAGYADVDGWFAGIGDGQVGMTRHHFKAWGLGVIGHEALGWGDEFDMDDPSTISEQYSGAIGVALFPVLSRRVNYMPS